MRSDQTVTRTTEPSHVKLKMARPEASKPQPLGVEDRYSIQLSYGRFEACHSTKRRRVGSAPATARASMPGGAIIDHFLGGLVHLFGGQQHNRLGRDGATPIDRELQRRGGHVVRQISDHESVGSAKG